MQGAAACPVKQSGDMGVNGDARLHGMGSSKQGRDGIAGKKIWMTGAANGIGRAVAEALISAKCGGMAIVDILDESEGQDICKKLETSRTKVVYYKCDVRGTNEVLGCMKAAIAEVSGVDIVINNAGIVDEDSLERCMAVNFHGVVNGTEAAVQLGVRRVINMGSAAGVFPLPEGAYYSASKHGVVGYSRSIGQRLRDEVKICCVCPGFIDRGIGVGRGWTDGGVGVMKISSFVDMFLRVVRDDYGDGRVFYVSEKLGVREVRVDVRSKLPMARL